MTPRILICAASIGAGHIRAGQALQLAIAQLCPGAVVENVDILADAGPLFRRIYGQGYVALAHKLPHVVGYLYDKIDKPADARRWSYRMKLALERMQLKRFIRRVCDGDWDLAINTHFLPAEIIASLKRDGRVAFPQMTVATDFDPHSLWVNPPCEHYFTACDEGRMNLSAHVPLDIISSSGIPIHPVFAQEKDAPACRQRQGIGNDRPVILQLAGGGGFGAIDTIYRHILQVQMPLHVVVVAGRNTQAKQRLEAMPCPPQHRRTILGFTDQMDELMAAADVIVSKPGGLTCSEVLARGAAMVIIDPIPGQESHNCDLLLEYGAALKVNNVANLPHKLTGLLGNPDRLRQMRTAARAVGRPQAAFVVARRALEILGHRLQHDVAADAMPPELQLREPALAS